MRTLDFFLFVLSVTISVGCREREIDLSSRSGSVTSAAPPAASDAAPAPFPRVELGWLTRDGCVLLGDPDRGRGCVRRQHGLPGV